MYDWFFYRVYQYLKNKNNHDAQFNATTLTFIVQVVHFISILLLASNLMSYKIPKIKSKWSFFPLGIIWLILLFWYFKKRLETFENKFDNETLTKKQFLILLIFVLLLPLLLIIKLSGGQIWK